MLVVKRFLVVSAAAVLLGACGGSQAPAHIADETSCDELQVLFDDADADFQAAYDAGDSDNMDRALDVQNAVIARMEELAC